MTEAQKKVAAALAAVNTYLQEEQSLAQQQEAAAAQPTFQGINPWALTGRQQMMSMRQMIQMKTFSRM
jgi:hypothetical protein